MSDFHLRQPLLDQVVRRAELMDQMMETVGVDAARLARLDHGLAWYEARSRCLACLNERACRAWIAATKTAHPQPPPDACANAEMFRALMSGAGSNVT